MVRHGKTKFQDQWMLELEFKTWLKKHSGDIYSASCILCPGSIISVSTMGRQALVSHMKSQKHQLKMKAQDKQLNVGSFFNQQNLSPPAGSCFNNVSPNPAVKNPLPSTSSAMPSDIVEQTRDVNFRDPHNNKSPAMKKFILSSEATKAEIIWCLHSVATHRSNRATAKDIQMLKYMFPENEAISKMTLDRTKTGYLTLFGLAPFFKEKLLADLKNSDNIVISFDESLNKVSQSQQMDIIVRFWNSETDEVSTRYLTSAFLKKATAADLLSAFLAAVSCIDLNKLIQISMDGPNVNKKFLYDLEEHLSDDLKLEHKMLNLGTCGLHSLHCAFKAAVNSTQWDVIAFLRAIYNFFKDHPSRRGAFTQITGSPMFPKKFCAVRWLENEAVAQRAIDIVPHLKVYFSSLETGKTNPNTKSCNTVLKQLKDPLLSAKLAFFKTLSSDIQPLLSEYQSDLPLAPFLYSSIRTLIVKEMERFVVPEKVYPLAKVLKKSENILPPSKIQVGIGAKCEIGKCKDDVTTLQVNVFKNDCKNALILFVERLLEKSPLQHVETKLITCLDPTIAFTELGHKRFENIVILLTTKNLISSQTAEKSLDEFKTICNKTKDRLKNFKRVEKSEDGRKTTNSLDKFWIGILRECGIAQSSLATVFKKLLILSHGNAHVERGFSVNKECIVENLHEESLVGLRTVYDTIINHGSVESVPISKGLILSAKNARSKYMTSLENKRKDSMEEAGERAAKRRNNLLIRELEEKKQKLMTEARREAEDIDNKISNLVKL